MVTIIIEGRKQEWTDKTISFSQLVEFVFKTQLDEPNDAYSVRYRDDSSSPWQYMKFSDPVEVKNDMEFNVRRNSNS